jgi:hypothetical protein
MRKHFAPTPPSEDVRSIKRVSLEEELIMVDQANQHAMTADNCLNETERLSDLAGALEDLAVIADGIEQPTATELDLIDRCAQMAVAGTDVSPDELLKGPPLAVGQSIATEGWKETASKIWKTIKAFMAKIWEAIDKFFKVHVILPSMFARLELVLKQMKNRTEKLKYGAVNKFEVKTGVQYFSNGQKLQKTAAEFVTELTKFGQAVELVYVENPKRVHALGKDIAAAIHAWEPDDTDGTVTKMVDAVSKLSKSAGGRLPMPFTATEGEFKATTSYELLGGVYFKFTSFEGGGGDLPTLERLRHTGLTLVEGEDPKDDELTFTHGNKAAYEKMIDMMSEMLQTIAQFNRASSNYEGLKGLRQVKTSIEKVSEDAIRDTIRKDSDPLDAAYVRSMLNFNPTFARWVQQPAVPFYTKVIGLARTVIMLVSHYNSLYEVDNKEAEAKITQEMQGAKA